MGRVILNRLKAFAGNQNGAAAVEFAFVGNLFILTLIGVFGVGYTIMVKTDLERSLVAAERYALVTLDENDAAIKNVIEQELAVYDPNDINMTFSRATAGDVDYVKVTLSYNIDIGTSFAIGPFSIITSRVFPT